MPEKLFPSGQLPTALWPPNCLQLCGPISFQLYGPSFMALALWPPLAQHTVALWPHLTPIQHKAYVRYDRGITQTHTDLNDWTYIMDTYGLMREYLNLHPDTTFDANDLGLAVGLEPHDPESYAMTAKLWGDGVIVAYGSGVGFRLAPPPRFITNDRHVIDTLAYNHNISLVPSAPTLPHDTYAVYRLAAGNDVIVQFNADNSFVDAGLDDTDIYLDMNNLIALFTGWVDVSDILNDYDPDPSMTPAGFAPDGL